MREVRPGPSGRLDVGAVDEVATLDEDGDPPPATWSAEQIIERLVAQAREEELPRDALPREAVPACCVESRRWPPVAPVHRACLRPPRRRRRLAGRVAMVALTVSFALSAAAGLAFAYQRAGTFTAWGLAAGYRDHGQRLLDAGYPELSLPFFFAARQQGDESAELKRRFAAALRERDILAGALPATARAWPAPPDLRSSETWRELLAQSRFSTVAAAMAEVRRLLAR